MADGAASGGGKGPGEEGGGMSGGAEDAGGSSAVVAESKHKHSLAVHFAVWRREYKVLGRLLESRAYDLETRDPQGLTPLLLAYLLGDHRAALMLIASGAYAKSRLPAPQRWEAHQLSALSKNPHLTRSAVMAMLLETDAAWERRVPSVAKNLAELPDFDMELHWEFSTWIPLVGGLFPRDTMRVRKRGGSIRIEYTLLGMEGLSWARGDLAYLILAGDEDTPGRLLVLDNEHKTAGDGRDAFVDPQDYQVQDWVRKLLSREQKVSDWWSRSVEFRREHVRDWLGSDTGEPAKETVCTWEDASVWTMVGVRLTEWVHRPILPALPVEAWWKPSYAQAFRKSTAEKDSTATPTAEMVAHAAAHTYGDASAPESGLAKFHDAIRSLESMSLGDGGEEGGATPGSVDAKAGGVRTRVKRTFKEHFLGKTEGWVDPTDEEEHNRSTRGGIKVDDELDALDAEELGRSSAEGAGEEAREIGSLDLGNVSEKSKVMDWKVCFTRDFPLSVRQILPVVECIARTGRHFANFRTFFDSKLPKDQGFPVLFSIPVFPAVNATISFGKCELVTPPAELFRLPPDYKLGEYVERGLIRQL